MAGTVCNEPASSQRGIVLSPSRNGHAFVARNVRRTARWEGLPPTIVFDGSVVRVTETIEAAINP